VKKFFTVILLVSCIASVGQQTPQYTQYVFNMFALNPALAGSKKCMDVKLGYRSQWLGFSGAPKTAFLSIHSRLKFKKKKSIRNYHGIGAYVENDEMGYLSRSTLYLAYAYHMTVGRDVKASIGLFAGIQQFKVDATQMMVVHPSDPALLGSGSAFVIPDISPGIFLSSKHWFAGLSVRQVVPMKLKVIGTSLSKNVPHFFLVGGKRMVLNDYISFIPSAQLKYAPFSAPAIDINALFGLTDNLEIGASWRNIDALAGMVKIKFWKYFSLGYSFDLTTSKIRHGSSNTHEVILGIYACPQKEQYSCPAFN